MNGLYALKPWYADRLSGLRRALAARQVSPDTLTAAGVVCAAGAAAALAWLPTPSAALPVAVLLAGRLAFANLDGALARDTGRTTRRGALLNELGDRAADLLVIAGFLPLAPLWLVAAAAFAATLPSWVSLAGAAAGAPRRNGGPVGKTERCLLAVVAAASGWAVPVLAVVAAGSAVTAVVRAVWVWRALGKPETAVAAVAAVAIECAATTESDMATARGMATEKAVASEKPVVRVAEPTSPATRRRPSPSPPPPPPPSRSRSSSPRFSSPPSEPDRSLPLDPGEVSGGITHTRPQSPVDRGTQLRGTR
ncbi:CDP-alcohol phosphatidyltransferase family protein [Streptomyces sp. NPDC056938]|uniref:CDP-alcohol phosphatidyltransferase family protein n=1 Tax=unclassified Streptomyces TaxID=2593676 RepID=UPI00363F5741